jgi:DNA-binding XRE family transcriptional regulator
MPDITKVLREEIARLARREIRAETDALKKASTHYRSEIAELKRRIATLERQLAGVQKRSASAGPAKAAPVDAGKVRFGTKGLKSLRQRLELSAAEFAVLLGVSAQTIYNWESGTTRPRPEQVLAIAALRGVGKREAAARVANNTPAVAAAA